MGTRRGYSPGRASGVADERVWRGGGGSAGAAAAGGGHLLPYGGQFEGDMLPPWRLENTLSRLDAP